MQMIEGTGGDKDYLVVAKHKGHLLAYKHYGFKLSGKQLLVHYRLRAVPDPDSSDQGDVESPAEVFEDLTFEKKASNYASLGGALKIDVTTDANDLLLEEVVSGSMTEKMMKHLSKKIDDDAPIEGLAADLKAYYSPIVNKAIKVGDVEAKTFSDAVYLKQFAHLKDKYASLFGHDKAEAVSESGGVMA